MANDRFLPRIIDINQPTKFDAGSRAQNFCLTFGVAGGGLQHLVDKGVGVLERERDRNFRLGQARGNRVDRRAKFVGVHVERQPQIVTALETDEIFPVAFGTAFAIFLVLVNRAHVKIRRLEIVRIEADLDNRFAEHFDLLIGDFQRGGVFDVLRRQSQRQDDGIGSLFGVPEALDVNCAVSFAHEAIPPKKILTR